MAITEAQKLSKTRYRKEKRDQLTVEIPKGKRAAYRLVANELGLSMARLVQNAVEEYAQNHANNVPVFPQTAEEFLTERENLLLERFAYLPDKPQLEFIRLMGDFAEQFGAQIESEEAGEEQWL